MRCVTVSVVLTLLLNAHVAHGSAAADRTPAPLTFFAPDATRGASSPLLIVEAYYNALRADEYVTLANVDSSSTDLTGWALSDGEGTLTFAAGSVAAADHVVVAQNSTAYFEDTLEGADYRYVSGNATPMIVAGAFQLNNGGDEILLRDPTGAIRDVFRYGTSSYSGPGWTGNAAKAVGSGLVARRAQDSAWRDTDSAADWDLVRVWSLGQSDLPSASFTVQGPVVAFVSPDESLGALGSLLANATSSIDLEVYTLTSGILATHLEDALARHVRVRILLEGGPVGGIDSDEWALALALASAGADVRFMVNNTTRDIQERYRYVHAKYAILDGRAVVVSSENWGPSGFPPHGTGGSRGWTLAVTDAPLAAYFGTVFEGDFDGRRRDIAMIETMIVRPSAPEPSTAGERRARLPARIITGTFRVTPVLAPESSLAADTIIGALRAATHAIDAELFYAYPDWGTFPNLYLQELVSAARRGVSVRLLLDSSPPNVEDGGLTNNTNTIAFVTGIAEREGLPLRAKLIDLPVHGFTEVHNKGLLIDGRTTLVSSINWNRNSATANREVGLLVENEDVAAYFAEAFTWDWKDDVTPPRADAGPDRTVDKGEAIAFSGLGSGDDVGVTNYSWDFDGDGRVDRWGPEPTYTYERPGVYRVELHVADAWGNTANATAIVTVRAVDRETDAPILWLIPILATAAVFVVLAVRRHRKGIK